MSYQHGHLLPQAVARRALDDGANVALQHVDGTTLTWSDGYADALRWAHALERLGVSSGEPVVTLFANGFDSFRSWLGCSWLRAIESPVNTAYKGEWLRHVVNNTQANVVLAEARFVQPLFEIARDVPALTHVVVFGAVEVPADLPFQVLSGDEFLDGAEPKERAEPAPWDISSLIYTSGTTGRSKAVMVPWGQNEAVDA